MECNGKNNFKKESNGIKEVEIKRNVSQTFTSIQAIQLLIECFETFTLNLFWEERNTMK